MSISAVLIVKNEEKRLKNCLESLLPFSTEIIILDSGSTDRTLSIAQEYTDKVYRNTEWLGFGKQRQLAQSYASSDWILTIDADEVITPELADDIKATIYSHPLNTVFTINRRNWAFGKFIKHSGWNPDRVIRLYPREKASYCNSLVHESVIHGDLSIKHLKGRLLHYTYDSLHDYNSKVPGYLDMWANQREGKKKSSILKGISHGIFAFIRMYILKLGFLDGRHGFILAFLTAFTTSQKYFDLWLRQYQKKNNGKQ